MEIRCEDCGQRNRIPDERDRPGVWTCGRCTSILLADDAVPTAEGGSPAPAAGRSPSMTRTWDFAERPSVPSWQATAARILTSLTATAERAASALTDWWRRHVLVEREGPPILWHERSDTGPSISEALPAVTDPTTGERVAPGADVYVCADCEATYLAANWRDLKARNGDACPLCHGRRCVKRGGPSAGRGHGNQ